MQKASSIRQLREGGFRDSSGSYAVWSPAELGAEEAELAFAGAEREAMRLGQHVPKTAGCKPFGAVFFHAVHDFHNTDDTAGL